MSDPSRAGRPDARHGRVRIGLVSVRCLLRGMPLFFRAAPRTPLRVLGIIALDTLHRLRHSEPLPRRRVRELAAFLDFQGCANAAWDHKAVSAAQYQAIRQQLEHAGLGSCIEAYLDRLEHLEGRRPPVGGDSRHFDDVRSYREEVARLSLGAAAAIALHSGRLDEGIRSTRCDSDVETLFRILMQCQIIDDVLDYPADLGAGLPSFLTACASLPQAMDLTALASRSYAAGSERPAADAVFPLRMALSVVTTMTKLVKAGR